MHEVGAEQFGRDGQAAAFEEGAVEAARDVQVSLHVAWEPADGPV